MTTIRQKLLQVVQNSGRTRSLRSFPLHAAHFRLEAISFSPSQFHAALCKRIRCARHRVHLAALYVGPAANPLSQPREADLLNALQTTSCPSVRILLDRNRALRPIPNGVSSSTTSAAACLEALSSRENPEVYLISVLPNVLQSLLWNPFNEIAGVFHMKVFVIDDDLILTGANLSEEYFVDRIDRYLWIQHGGNGLVDFYAHVLDVLSSYAERYGSQQSRAGNKVRRSGLMRSLTHLITTDQTSLPTDDPTIVAYAVPTLQIPAHFWDGIPECERFLMDIPLLDLLLREAMSGDSENCRTSVRLASAYLNLVDPLQEILLEHSSETHLLTAGPASHGFKSKGKPGNKGNPWIAQVFDALARDYIPESTSSRHNLWYYQRDHWTFHAKGIWVSIHRDKQSCDESTLSKLCNHSDLVLVSVGSSNYGARSTVRDWESNLLLLTTENPGSLQFQNHFASEWNSLNAYAVRRSEVLGISESALSWPWRLFLPFVRSFF